MRKLLSQKISSYLLPLLKVLTKPQRKYFLTYLLGLMTVVKFRSIREIASQCGRNNSQGLHHFIKHSAKTAGRLEEENRQQLAEAFKTKEAIMILDDTPCPRNGKKIEGIGFHHSIHGPVRGLCAVTAILKSGSERLAWAIRGYRSKKSCPPEAFKSKVKLAQEILQDSFLFFPQLTVVMDVWYACASILNPIQENGWVFLAAIKRNRFLFVGDKKISASHLAKGPRKYKTVRVTKKKWFQVARKKVFLPEVGPILVFITKLKGGESRFFVTNNLDMTESEMVFLYTERFMIELFHKEIKQHLGFGEMFMRSWSGIQIHWTLIMIAYNTISLWNGTNPRSFRKTICHFKDSISHDSFRDLLKTVKK